MSDENKQDTAEPSPASRGSAHTPGPWEVKEYYAVGRGLQVHQAGVWHSLAEVRGIGQPNQTDYANARLIAAAPDMLDALLRQQANIRRWLETGVPADAGESRSILEQIDAAIAKATGQ